MLLRLLELQGSSRGASVDAQGAGNRGGAEAPQSGRPVTSAACTSATGSVSTFSLPDLPTEPTRPPRPSTNPIVTADSIISTLQMEMATAGLTADAILAATRHLETVVRPTTGRHTMRESEPQVNWLKHSGAAERPCIAPRPSLGRISSRDSGGAGEPGGAGLAGLLGESLGALLLPSPVDGRIASSTATREEARPTTMRGDGDGILEREEAGSGRQDGAVGRVREEEQEESPQRDQETTP